MRGMPVVSVVLLGAVGSAQPAASPAEIHSWTSGYPTPVTPEGARATQEGLATWYGEALRGHKTASGERFDPDEFTAAHRTLPLGTEVLVERLDTGKTVAVRINDRGPFGDDRRIVDLSKRAARELGMIGAGVARVRVTLLRAPEPASPARP